MVRSRASAVGMVVAGLLAGTVAVLAVVAPVGAATPSCASVKISVLDAALGMDAA